MPKWSVSFLLVPRCRCSAGTFFLFSRHTDSLTSCYSRLLKHTANFGSEILSVKTPTMWDWTTASLVLRHGVSNTDSSCIRATVLNASFIPKILVASCMSILAFLSGMVTSTRATHFGFRLPFCNMPTILGSVECGT